MDIPTNTALFTSSEMAELFGADAALGLPDGWMCTGVSTDTRTLCAGNLFVALVGERFDAHMLLSDAAQKGASAAIVSNAFGTGGLNYGSGAAIPAGSPTASPAGLGESGSLPCIPVPNTLHALGRLAHMHRRRFQVPVVAVAGAAGKTTTKDMIAHVLKRKFGDEAVLKTEGNLNNQVGVPLTLLRLDAAHAVAVVEIGTNEPGEIEMLSAMVAPTHGIITNIGKEHLEKLRDLDGVEREETALFRFLETTGGTAFINMDDERLRKYAAYAPSLFTFGIAHKADLAARVELSAEGHPQMYLSYKRGVQRATAEVQLRVVGHTMAYNALAAAAVGCGFGLSLAEIVSALITFVPTASQQGYGRMVVETFGDITLLNDCYNANPVSMEAALATLRAMSPLPHCRRFAVLGDMRELGEASLHEHCLLLERLAADAAFERILLVGNEMERAYSVVQGSQRYENEHVVVRLMLCASKEAAGEFLCATLQAGDIVLVKGSRGVRLEEVVHALHEHFSA